MTHRRLLKCNFLAREQRLFRNMRNCRKMILLRNFIHPPGTPTSAPTENCLHPNVKGNALIVFLIFYCNTTGTSLWFRSELQTSVFIHRKCEERRENENEQMYPSRNSETDTYRNRTTVVTRANGNHFMSLFYGPVSFLPPPARKFQTTTLLRNEVYMSQDDERG